MYDMVPRLAALGIDLVVHPLLPDVYVRSLRVDRPTTALALAASYLRRTCDMVTSGGFDALFIQYEALPFVPAAIERFLLPARTPWVLDYDDAWHHHYDAHGNAHVRRWMTDKVPRLIEAAAAVVVGSTYLEEYARQRNARVVRIPTSIDVERYPAAPVDRDMSRAPVIGWIGSPSTSPYLRAIAAPLETVACETGATVRLVGAADHALSFPGVESHAWSEATEVGLIATMDVGIMPLPDEPFARGKCAFKLIQYMGAWKPVVASPVGENRRVVTAGENGFLPTTDSEWVANLKTLLGDATLSRRFGKAGRQRVEHGYDQGGAAERLADLFRSVAR